MTGGRASRLRICGRKIGDYGAATSFQEVLAALPELTPEERDLLRVRLAEFAEEEWRDADELSAEEKALIEERTAKHGRRSGT